MFSSFSKFFKMISLALTFCLSVVMAGGSVLPENSEPGCKAKFTGTFVQSWLSSQWSEERWAKEVETMEKDGIEYLVLQDIANMNSNDEWTVYYDSDIEAFSTAEYPADVVKAALKAVKGSNIKVFVGLTMFDDFWTTGTLTSKYDKVCDITAQMLEDIYNSYYNSYSDNFYGWYFTMELNNILNCQIGTSRAVKGLNKVLNKASEVDSSLPLMMSPFTSNYLSVGKTAAFMQWYKVFTSAAWRDGDIIAPQDAVGADWVEEEDLKAIWEMYYMAINESEADLRLWANCENFTLAIADSVGAGFITRPASENVVSVPATLDRFIRQMEIASQYCENIITFSYTHYYSKNEVSDVFIETYRDYVSSNFTLEKEAPVMGEFNKCQTDNGVELNWVEAQDNIGISYYRIEKNGEFLCRCENFDGYHRLSYTDESGSINDSYTITAYDAAGNQSKTVVAK